MIYAHTYYFYGKPLCGLEYKQKWKLTEDNHFQFISYCETKKGRDKISRSYDLILEEDEVKEIYELLSNMEQIESKDFIEQWQCTIDEVKKTGSMSGNVYANGVDVTKRLRELIPIKNFWVFNSVDCEYEAMTYCME